MNVHQFMDMSNNFNIVNAIAKTWDILGRFQKPVCSISGGADSDIMLDIVHKLDEDKKVSYVWVNTGLEYEATKKHLSVLEEKYNIHIKRIDAVKPIPMAVAEYGVPFLSKLVSERIRVLQKKGFHFSENSSYEQDIRDFPKCISSLKWWHNIGSMNCLNVSGNRGLKQFLCAHPPDFPISGMCCEYAKKKPFIHFIQDLGTDLQIIGTRKSEGGIRSIHNTCFTYSQDRGTVFRPVFWFLNKDKEEYCKTFGVEHSDCYSIYGFKRTGCAGCPFNKKIMTDLEAISFFEPKLAKATKSVFGRAYQYTRLYREFLKKY